MHSGHVQVPQPFGRSPPPQSGASSNENVPSGQFGVHPGAPQWPGSRQPSFNNSFRGSDGPAGGDTFGLTDSHAHLKPPKATATSEERLAFIDQQLDSFGKEPVLMIYGLLGVAERRRGGVPSASHMHAPCACAVLASRDLCVLPLLLCWRGARTRASLCAHRAQPLCASLCAEHAASLTRCLCV